MRPVVGFTGTKRGMTDSQKIEFKKWIRDQQPRLFHHGDCVGADAEAHDIVWDMIHEEGLNCSIVIHPPIDEKFRAFKGENQGFITILPPTSYLSRNKAIVRAASILAATPRRIQEQLRSGTWATIRYARAKPIPVQIFEP